MIETERTGMVDTYHAVLRDYPARIDLSAGGKKTLNGNCLRCHENTMGSVHMAVGVDMDTGADCLKCHSRIAHGSNHLEGGIKVE
jgi:cytochrome c nitrite reductase small subunit